MQRERDYQARTAEAESAIRDIVDVARASRDGDFKRNQKAIASGFLHEWIEVTEQQGDAPQSFTSDRHRLVALINTAMLDA